LGFNEFVVAGELPIQLVQRNLSASYGVIASVQKPEEDKMKTTLVFLMLGLSLMSACLLRPTVQLYPVHGPLSAQTPLPVFPGKVTGLVNSGNISFVMRDGEVCKGRWTRVVPVKTPNGAMTANTQATDDMPSVWDTVYGPGFYVSHVLGTNYHAQAKITGDRGTVVNVEFYRADPGRENISHLFGVARDDKDNIYKMVFNIAGAP
jgi:hypothetical protein